MTQSPNFFVVRLHFKAPFHLGLGKENEYSRSLKHIPSDTLHSALVACSQQLFGQSGASPEFVSSWRLSSAFPFFGLTKEDTRWYFPKPMIKLPLHFADNQPDAPGRHKWAKQIAWLEKSVFEQVLAGNPILVEEGHFGTSGLLDLRGELTDKSLSKSYTQQRVTVPVPGVGEDPKPFLFDRVYLGVGAGLFTLITCPEVGQRKKLEAAFKLLGDHGIGADRNLGNGNFEPEWSEMTLNLPAHPTHKVNLSLFCPERGELEGNLQDSSYLLSKRGGFISSIDNEQGLRLRKRSVFMFREGSIFPDSCPCNGKLLDLRPVQLPGQASFPHPVWRDGRPITLPILVRPTEMSL
mgnify:CR=1 FL=1